MTHIDLWKKSETEIELEKFLTDTLRKMPWQWQILFAICKLAMYVWLFGCIALIVFIPFLIYAYASTAIKTTLIIMLFISLSISNIVLSFRNPPFRR